MKKLIIDKIQSIANLRSAYQLCKVLIVPAQGENYPSKVGIEIQLIPIVDDKELKSRYRPKSMFFNKNEIKELDRLILALVKARWKFSRDEKTYDTDFVDELVGYYCKILKDSVISGIQLNKGFKTNSEMV